MYMMMKHLHLTAVVLSIVFFIVRFAWRQMDSAMSSKKWVKILPHVIDTGLLLSAATLCVILSQYPFAQGWVTFKLFGVVAYILFGMVAMKWATTRAMQWAGFAAAIVTLVLVAKVAVLKQPLFF